MNPSTLKRFGVPLFWSITAHAGLFLAIAASTFNTPTSPSHALNLELRTTINSNSLRTNTTKSIANNHIANNKTLSYPAKTPALAVKPVVANSPTIESANIAAETPLNNNSSTTDNPANTVTANTNSNTEQPTLAIENPIFDAAFLNNPQPTYPLFAKKRQQEGTVMLKVQVSTDGKAEAVELAKSSGFSLLDDAAQQAVEKWQFIPARRGDLVIAASVIVPIRFALR
jgi:protein TonB